MSPDLVNEGPYIFIESKGIYAFCLKLYSVLKMVLEQKSSLSSALALAHIETRFLSRVRVDGDVRLPSSSLFSSPFIGRVKDGRLVFKSSPQASDETDGIMGRSANTSACGGHARSFRSKTNGTKFCARCYGK